MNYYKKEKRNWKCSQLETIRTGQQQITSGTEDRRITTTSKRNRPLTPPEITNTMNNSQEDPISVTTVKRQLMEAGFCGGIAVRKPLLWSQNKKKKTTVGKST